MFCVNSFGCVSTRVCTGFFRAIEQKNRELFGPAGAAVPDELSVINVGVEDFTAERAGQTVGRGLPTGSFKLYVGFLKVAIRVGLLPDLVGLAVGRRAGRLGRFMVLGFLVVVGHKIALDVGFFSATTALNSSLVNSPLPS